MKTQGWIRTASAIAALTIISACGGQANFGLGSSNEDFSSTVQYDNRIDMILVMDTSSGMSGHYLDVAAAAPSFVNALTHQGLDLHIAIVTTSMGGSNDPNGGTFIGNRYYASGDSNFAGEVTDQLQNVVADGSDLTRGLDSVVTVLQPAYLATAAAKGFLRSDALLAVVAFTDQDDRSTTYSTDANYAAYFDSVKGKYPNGNRKWTVNFVGVTSLTSTCLSTGGPGGAYHEPGARWMDLASMSGGVDNSICTTDLGPAVSNIHTVIEQIITDYWLGAQAPDMATIVVTKDGVSVPEDPTNGWQYIAATNSIRLYGTAIPTAYQHIHVSFTPANAN